MNIQIFGKRKCFETKKAQRWFKERGIKFQYIDILDYGISKGELKSVVSAVGIDNVVDENDQDYPMYKYLANNESKFEKLLEDPYLIKTPIVRNSKKATVGYEPEIWKIWE